MSTPSANLPTPISLRNEGDALVIAWNDGVTHRLPWSLLREQCPCATCRVKRAEPPPLLSVLAPEEAQPPRPTSLRPVGNYAYGINWNDGHSSGIYSLELLRRLGEALDSRQGGTH